MGLDKDRLAPDNGTDSQDHVAGDQAGKQANRQAQWDILARAGKAELHACRGSNVHACRGSGMECRGSARRRGGGGTGAHTGPSHWVNQISLDLPRASDPVWVAGRSL